MEDVLKPEFQQGFDFFWFFGDFDCEFVVGSGFEECVFDVYVNLCGCKLLVPFGAAYTTTYKSRRKTKRGLLSKELMIISKTSLIFALLLFFSLLLLCDLTGLGGLGELLVLAGDAGVLIVTMTAFFSLLPFHPLDGKVLFDCSKLAWVGTIVLPGLFFGCYIYQLLTPVVFLAGGVVSACIFVITLFLGRTRLH